MCKANEALSYDDSDDDSDDDSSSETESRDNDTAIRPNRRAPAPAQATLIDSPVSSRTRGQTRSYCTQACLLGLVQGIIR